MIRKKPKNFEAVRPLNELLFYHNGKGIVLNETGELFYFPCEEEIFDIGCCIEEELLLPLTSLPVEEMKAVMSLFMEEIL